MKRLWVWLVAFGLLVSGCESSRVEPPSADALPTEVFEVYVRAIQANDVDTGKQMSEGCWFTVSHWFDKGRTIDHYELESEIPGSSTPSPQQLRDYVYFRYWDANGDVHTDMVAKLRRQDTDSPWQVCEIVYRYAP